MEIINYSGKKSYRSSATRKSVFRKETNRARYASSVIVSPKSFGFKNFLITFKEASILLLKTVLNIASFAWVIPAAIACVYFPKKSVDKIVYDKSFAEPVDVCMDNDWAISFLDKKMETFAKDTTPKFDAFGYIYVDDTVPLPEYSFEKPVEYRTVRYNQSQGINGLVRFTSAQGLNNYGTLVSINNITDVSEIPSKLKVPSMDGIIVTLSFDQKLDSLARKYGVKSTELADVNGLDSDQLTKGQEIFIPGGVLSEKQLEKIQGEKFIYPLRAKYYLTSKYGPRIDPISGRRNSFHTGIDLACPTGTPIYASMSGTVQVAGWHNSYGNYVIIKHKEGYQTLYAHMSKILVSKGTKITQGERVGLVGTTGYSTGPHLHFTVYKNGNLVDPLTILKK